MVDQVEAPGGSTVRAIARKRDPSARSIVHLRPISETSPITPIHSRGSRIGSCRRVHVEAGGESSFPLRKPAQSAPGGRETTGSGGRQTVARPSRERGSHSRIIGVIVGTNSVETTGSRVRRVSGSSTRDGSRLSPGVRADQQVDPLLPSLPLAPLSSPRRRSLSAERSE